MQVFTRRWCRYPTLLRRPRALRQTATPVAGRCRAHLIGPAERGPLAGQSAAPVIAASVRNCRAVPHRHPCRFACWRPATDSTTGRRSRWSARLAAPAQCDRPAVRAAPDMLARIPPWSLAPICRRHPCRRPCVRHVYRICCRHHALRRTPNAAFCLRITHFRTTHEPRRWCRITAEPQRAAAEGLDPVNFYSAAAQCSNTGAPRGTTQRSVHYQGLPRRCAAPRRGGVSSLAADASGPSSSGGDWCANAP